MTTIIGASVLVAICGVALLSAVLGWGRLCGWTKKTHGMKIPEKEDVLTHKKLETHGYALSAVATDALVQKHQAISIHSAD